MASSVDQDGQPRIVRLERLPAKRFAHDHAAPLVERYLQDKAGVEGDHNLPPEAVCALGPLIEHVKVFGIERVMAQPQLQPFETAVCMTLDSVTLRDLEVGR